MANSNNEERTMKSTKIFDGKVLQLRVDTVEMEGQKYTKREIVERQPAVGIVALTEDDEIILIKQYRKAIDKEIYEIPAGMVDFGEEPQKAALRELKEETGYDAEKSEYLLETYSSPGFTNEKLFIFHAEGLTAGNQNLDEFEHLSVEKLKFDEALKLVNLGEITDSKSVAGILYYNTFRRKNV
ncbi:NUDIX hydrolase [Peptoniphilus gorbachii]|uniref:ADP-ribose pyrophosphatase n=1 Tax=Peptoniphilus gorbachii TaxID=411567 RepID=A0ABS2MI54_9FIRM|nr:NUDIX hydrolase [Peptoniphilus gorbachii]MBM7549688.1 ADP-ribose pyrophosphatase [Peptoniphilus gorbachii]